MELISKKLDQMTFGEDDVKNVSDFINFVYKKGVFNLNTKETFEFTSLYSKMTQIIKKMDAHILEIKHVIESKKD